MHRFSLELECLSQRRPLPQPKARMEGVNVLHSQIFKKVPITYSAMPQNSRGQNKGTSLNIFSSFFPNNKFYAYHIFHVQRKAKDC